MTPPPIISNQRNLLEAMAKGGLLYRAQDEKSNKRQWWLKLKDSDARNIPDIRILLSTVDTASRHGHIKPVGFIYWRLTDAGKVHLAYLNDLLLRPNRRRIKNTP